MLWTKDWRARWSSRPPGRSRTTPPRGAKDILTLRSQAEFVIDTLANRAFEHEPALPQADRERLRQRLRERTIDLLNTWERVASDYSKDGVGLQYNPTEVGGAKQLLYDFLSPELKNLTPESWRMKFRANRSLRDVEPSVNLWVRTLDNAELEEDLV